MNALLVSALVKLLPVVLGVFGKFLTAVVDDFLKDKKDGGLDVLDEVARITAVVVKDLAKSGMTDDEKRKAAVRMAKQEAKRLGREISDSYAEILVQAAWKAVR